MDRIIDRSSVRAALPPRAEDGHKGTFGKLLIVGGSVGYTGAPYLAAEAAVFAGAGLVYLGLPRSIWAVEAAKCDSAMPFPLPDQDGALAAEAADAAGPTLGRCDVLALGPGLGRRAGTAAAVRTLIKAARKTDMPLVLDADALLPELPPCPGAVLTPHDGEFARLSGASLEDIAGPARRTLARAFVAERGCTLVLKGHPTLTALPDGSIWENTTGGCELAKGGSGDVLTGLIAALLAQGAGPENAAACAVWLHGRAGELLARRLTKYAVTPLALAREGVPLALREIIGEEQQPDDCT